MQNLVASLLAQLSPKSREHEVLTEIIDRLERQQQTLEHRLSTETRGAERRHLKVRLEVGRLQLKKTVTLRTNLTSTHGYL